MILEPIYLPYFKYFISRFVKNYTKIVFLERSKWVETEVEGEEKDSYFFLMYCISVCVYMKLKFGTKLNVLDNV